MDIVLFLKWEIIHILRHLFNDTGLSSLTILVYDGEGNKSAVLCILLSWENFIFQPGVGNSNLCTYGIKLRVVSKWANLKSDNTLDTACVQYFSYFCYLTVWTKYVVWKMGVAIKSLN